MPMLCCVKTATKNLRGNENNCILEQNIIESLCVSMQGHRSTKLLPNCCRRRTNGRNGDTRTGEGETFLIREYLHSSVHTVKERHGTSSVYVSLNAECQSSVFVSSVPTAWPTLRLRNKVYFHHLHRPTQNAESNAEATLLSH